MTEKLIESIKHLSNANIYGMITIIVVSVIGGFVYLAIKKPELLKFVAKKKNSVKDLIKHNVFTGMYDVLDDILDENFTSHGDIDPVKTKLIHELAKIQIQVIDKRLRKMLVDDENDSLDEVELSYKVKTHKRTVVEEYREKSIDIFYTKYGVSKEDGAFLTDSYIKYRKFFNDGFDRQIEWIVGNNKYSTNYDKVSVILELIHMSLQLIPKDAKIAMDEVNGRFRKYEKNG